MKKRAFQRVLAMFLILSLLLGSLFTGTVAAAVPAADGFVLFDGTAVADLYLDGSQEYAQVIRAAGDLQQDIVSVTGKEPRLLTQEDALSSNAVIIGTLGSSAVIDRLVEDGKLDVSGISGQWEAFTLQLVESPQQGVEQALVIAGSDMRGTIYGIYDLCEQIGVSPWYWWGDVPVARQTQVVLSPASVQKTEMPDVQYRGIFINDEESFTYWSRILENDTDSPGTPNANTYAKIFELLLRLKANTLWPAMHEKSTAFNGILNPETGVSYNAEKAAEYGIIMGTSHCEMLLRNNATEWTPWCEANVGKYNLEKVNNSWSSSYDYTVNPEAMNAYWEEAVARNYKFDNLYTIGLRAVHDGAINCRDLNGRTRTQVVQEAVDAQVAILEKYEAIYEQETGEKKVFPKIYCSYKEAATYFQSGLVLPSDTIIVWGDDNFGYVREVSSTEELANYPSSGVYYHVSYLGAPSSYIWIAGTPLPLIYEEMTKSYNAGSDDCWILNVGDLKPAEIPMEFFLSMAWDHDAYDDTTIPDYLESVAKRDFALTDTQAQAVADVLKTYYDVSIAKRAEYQGLGITSVAEYSMTDYGDEAQLQINRMEAALAQSTAIYEQLPAAYQDAYYQLVHYMIRALTLTLEKNIYQYKNQLYLSQGRFASVNAYAQLAEDAYAQILADLKYYNKTLSGGRWDGIMDPYNRIRYMAISGNNIAAAPSVTYLGQDMAVEGIGSVCEGQSSGDEDVPLLFHSLTQDVRFVDVFNTGLNAQTYEITADDMLVITKTDGTPLEKTGAANGKSTYTGQVQVEERLLVSVDWSKVPTGITTASITVSGEDADGKTYAVQVNKTKVDPATEVAAGHNGYYETNGVVAIEAEHYSNNVAVNGQEWKVVQGLGRGTDSMKNYPDLSGDSVKIDSPNTTNSPYLEYEVYFETTGAYRVYFYRIPTLNEGSISTTNRTSLQFDDGALVDFTGNRSVESETGNVNWRKGVLQNMEILQMSSNITVSTPGWHTVRIFKKDAATAFDRIVLENTSKTEVSSVLGAPENFTTTADYQVPGVGVPPQLSLDNITYGDAVVDRQYLYDFSASSAGAASGYSGIDNKAVSFSSKGFVWDQATFANVQAATRSISAIATRDLGIVYGSSAVGFTVNLPSPGEYLVSFAIGDRQSGGISTKNMTVKANGETLLSGLNVNAGQTVERGFILTVEEVPLHIEVSGSNWVLAALEIAPYTAPETNGGTGAFIPDGSGSINIEAEIALENSSYAWYTPGRDADSSSWSLSYGYSGAAMFSGPNKGNNFSNTNLDSNSGPKMFYQVDFAEAGAYDMWVLVRSQNDNDDSLLVSLDGGTAVSFNDSKDMGATFKWLKLGSQVQVGSAGVHTLSIWEREDGILLDKFVLTKSSGPLDKGGVMCRVGGVTQVSFEALEQAIAQAEALQKDDYVEARFAVLQAAVASAKVVPETATQAEVDAAVKAITKASNELIKKSVINADVTTGLVAKYEFEGDWSNSLNPSQVAVPAAKNNALPTLETDSQQGKVVKLNSGGSGNYSQVSFENPLYGTDIADGLTVSFLSKGIGYSDYEFILSATDGYNNFFWLSGELYLGYTGSRGWIDANKPDNLPGSSDKLKYMSNNTWDIVTVTFTDDEVVVYINGSPFLSTDDSNYTKGINYQDVTRVTDIFRWSKTIELGGHNDWWGSDNFYADDFMIYDRALTEDQVARLALDNVQDIVPVSADYTAVNDAIQQAEAVDRRQFSADSLAALDAAVANVVYHLPESSQSLVDGYAQAILHAIQNLQADLLLGDMNGDGKLSVTDVVLLRKAILAGNFDPVGDMNGDSNLSVTDVVLLRKAILNSGV